VRRGTAALVATLLLPSALAAQSSPYLPADDPRMALVEHLIARGEMPDPRPFVRPVRLAELEAALARANPRSRPSRAIVDGLRPASLRPDWKLTALAGGQAYSRARRDLLHPAGAGGARPYTEVRGALAAGPVAGAVRALWEPRLDDDPDWTDPASGAPRDAVVRLSDTYLTAGTMSAGVMYGVLTRSWGPSLTTGVPLGADGYAPPLLGFEGRLGPVTAMTMGGPLRPVANPVVQGVQRRFTARRLDVRLGRAAHLGLWESGISSTGSSGVAATLADPWRPLLLERLFGGSADDRNLLLGLDLSVRAGRALLVEAQAALDDEGSSGGPDDAARPARWGGALGLAGPLGTSLSWRGRISAGSSLLYRTPRPEEYYSDGMIGLGRNSADNVAATLSVGVPVRGAWLVTPELTWQRQGEGTLQDPFPEGEALATTPAFFIGTPSTLWQAGASFAGQQGPVALLGVAGVQHQRNADHVPGQVRTRVEARIQATIGFSIGGAWR
jgi:hypothetical protein